MKTIWKFVIDPKNLKLEMPVESKILTVQGQDHDICIWAEVDTEAEKEEVLFEVFGTGHELTENMGTGREYVGTAQMYGGSLVFHVYRWTGI
jgi:hypothetical protein